MRSCEAKVAKPVGAERVAEPRVSLSTCDADGRQSPAPRSHAAPCSVLEVTPTGAERHDVRVAVGLSHAFRAACSELEC